MTDPFLVPVPKGATHIDLRPHLMPLLLTVGRLALGHRICEQDIENALALNQREAPLIERAMRLRPEWVKTYLKQRGWHVSEHRYDSFQASIREGEGTVAFHSACVVLYIDHKESENGPRGWWNVLHEIGKFEGGWADHSSKLERVERALSHIEASVSAVDRLAVLA